MPRILVIDDSEPFCRELKLLLESRQYDTTCACTVKEGMELLKSKSWDLLLLDVFLDGGERGDKLLPDIFDMQPDLPVIMVSGGSTIDIAVKATQTGARDFIEKPVIPERLLLTIRNTLQLHELTRLSKYLLNDDSGVRMIGDSMAMMKLRREIENVAKTDSKVLILGPSGSGKDLVARSVHYRSERKANPFITINCAAIPENLLESEIFGFEKGAFSGADHANPGRLSLAENGTVFLDEIGDLSAESQAKILNFLNDGSYQHLGGSETIISDSRVICSSNKDLARMVENGTFREDLYYRVNVVTIKVPALNEHREDIPLLAEHFRTTMCEKYNKKITAFSRDALDLLMKNDWQGNVRELRSVIERLVVFAKGPVIDYAAVVSALNADRAVRSVFYNGSLQQSLADFERVVIIRHMQENDWNIRAAARAMEISEQELKDKCESYGIHKP